MDKIPLNSHQLFAFFFPGLVFVFPTIYCFYFSYIEAGSIDAFFKHYKDNEVLISFAVIVLASLSGLVIDSIRNGVIEWIIDKMVRDNQKKIAWDFFFVAEEKKVKVLYERYYNFYVFNLNTCCAIFLSWIFLFGVLPFHDFRPLFICELVAFFILIWESISLRSEIVEITHRK